MTAYATFAKAPALSPDAEAFTAECFKAGYQWAKAGNAKLPRMATVGDRQVPIVRSSHEWAHAFTQGWKLGRQG